MPNIEDQLRWELDEIAERTPGLDTDDIRCRRDRSARRTKTAGVGLTVGVVAAVALGSLALFDVFRGGAPQPAGPPIPTSQTFLFSMRRNLDEGFQLFQMEPDGTSLRRVGNPEVQAFSPQWSPDGSKIAFVGGEPTNGEEGVTVRGDVYVEEGVTVRGDMYVMDADGSNVEAVPARTYGRSPVWADEDTLVFTDDGGILWRTDLDGTDARPIVRGDDDIESSEPTMSPDGRWIAFTDSGGVGGGLGVVSIDGTQRGWLVPPGAGIDIQSPSWSPDGTKVAFGSDSKGDDVIRVVDVSSGQIEVLPSLQFIDGPVWSPDGTQIAMLGRGDGSQPGKGATVAVVGADGAGLHTIATFDGEFLFGDMVTLSWGPKPLTAPLTQTPIVEGPSPEPPTDDPDNPPVSGAVTASGTALLSVGMDPMTFDNQIWTLDLATGEYEPLIDDAELLGDARWSPDGTQIAYVRTEAPRIRADGVSVQHGTTAEILVADADGSNPRVLLGPVRHEVSSLMWSPDGQQLFYYRNERNREGIWSLDTDDGTERQVVEGYLNVPSLARDGSLFAFAAGFHEEEIGFPLEIFSADPATGEPRRLTENLLYENYAVVSPDGSRIAFSRSETNSDGSWNMYVIDADGEGEQRLTTWPGSEHPVDWSADGSQIMFTNARRDGDPQTEIYVYDVASSTAGFIGEARKPLDAWPTDWKP